MIVMPRSNDVIITINKTLHEQWKRLTVELNYGDRGKQKLLASALDYVEQHPEFFEKR